MTPAVAHTVRPGASRTSTPVSPAFFRAAMAELPQGVSIVTAWDDLRPVGATVSAVTSLSLEPPMILVCLATTSETLRALDAGHRVAVNILADGQQHLARRFAGKGTDKFANIEWTIGPHGLPEVAGCAVITGSRARELIAAGDHVIVVIEVEHVRIAEERLPLVLHRRQMVATQMSDRDLDAPVR